jgi:protein-L-isoaspartate(D-aspartate) O-methyltransferase
MSSLVQKEAALVAMTNMISQQIHTNGVHSEAILALLSEIPRASFVPLEYQSLAYSDTELPIGHQQTTLSPMLEAKIMQLLQLTQEDTVLEIGTGCGYMTALLAKQSHFVYSVDKYSEFTRNAAKKLAQFSIENVLLETGQAAHGWNAYAPYDVIVVTGSLPALEQHFLQQLKIGGRLFIVVGQAPCQTALLITRVSEKHWQQKKLFETVIPLLEDYNPVERFVF